MYWCVSCFSYHTIGSILYYLKKNKIKKNKISKWVYTRIAHFTDCDNVFQLNNSDSGNIVLIGKLDYEDKEYCNLTLTVNIENV